MSRDAGVVQRAQIAELREIASGAPMVVEKIATEIARTLRMQAVRSGHSIGIRVVRRTDGIRVTITGPHAARYRAPLERMLREQAPAAQAEIRVMLTRRAK